MVAAVRGRKRPERPKNFVPSANNWNKRYVVATTAGGTQALHDGVESVTGFHWTVAWEWRLVVTRLMVPADWFGSSSSSSRRPPPPLPPPPTIVWRIWPAGRPPNGCLDWTNGTGAATFKFQPMRGSFDNRRWGRKEFYPKVCNIYQAYFLNKCRPPVVQLYPHPIH